MPALTAVQGTLKVPAHVQTPNKKYAEICKTGNLTGHKVVSYSIAGAFSGAFAIAAVVTAIFAAYVVAAVCAAAAVAFLISALVTTRIKVSKDYNDKVEKATKLAKENEDLKKALAESQKAKIAESQNIKNVDPSNSEDVQKQIEELNREKDQLKEQNQKTATEIAKLQEKYEQIQKENETLKNNPVNESPKEKKQETDASKGVSFEPEEEEKGEAKNKPTLRQRASQIFGRGKRKSDKFTPEEIKEVTLTRDDASKEPKADDAAEQGGAGHDAGEQADKTTPITDESEQPEDLAQQGAGGVEAGKTQKPPLERMAKLDSDIHAKQKTIMCERHRAIQNALNSFDDNFLGKLDKDSNQKLKALLVEVHTQNDVDVKLINIESEKKTVPDLTDENALQGQIVGLEKTFKDKKDAAAATYGTVNSAMTTIITEFKKKPETKKKKIVLDAKSLGTLKKDLFEIVVPKK